MNQNLPPNVPHPNENCYSIYNTAILIHFLTCLAIGLVEVLLHLWGLFTHVELIQGDTQRFLKIGEAVTSLALILAVPIGFVSLWLGKTVTQEEKSAELAKWIPTRSILSRGREITLTVLVFYALNWFIFFPTLLQKQLNLTEDVFSIVSVSIFLGVFYLLMGKETYKFLQIYNHATAISTQYIKQFRHREKIYKQHRWKIKIGGVLGFFFIAPAIFTFVDFIFGSEVARHLLIFIFFSSIVSCTYISYRLIERSHPEIRVTRIANALSQSTKETLENESYRRWKED